MPTHRTRPDAATSHPSLTPPILADWLSAFRCCFTAPVWAPVLVLVAGAVLAPGKRTVSQALRVMGLAASPGFARYHEVLSRARWSGRAVARTLLAQVLDAFLPAGEVVIGEGVLIGIGYFIAGVPRPMLFTVLTIALAMLPFGARVAFAAAALLLLVQGGGPLLAGLLFGWGAIVMVIGDILSSPALLVAPCGCPSFGR